MLRKTKLRANGLDFSLLRGGKGEPIFFLHGFPDYYESFYYQMEYFASHGYEVFAPALRGYEPSSIPSNFDYYLVSLVEDFIEQLNTLKLERVHLVGHDWGAIITYAVSSSWPDRLISATAISVPYLKNILAKLMKYPSQVMKSWYILFFQVPGLSESLFMFRDFALLEKLYKDWSPYWEQRENYLQKIKKIFLEPQVLNSALSYYRCLADFQSKKGKESLELLRQKIETPIMIIYGLEDGSLDARLYESLFTREDFLVTPKIHAIAQAGHFVHLEKPETVNFLLSSWFKENKLT